MNLFEHRHTATKRRLVTRGLAVVVIGLSITILTASQKAFASAFGPSNPQRILLATAEARHLFTLALLPKGSRHIASWIAADGSQLSMPMSPTGNLNQVDIAEFLLAPSAGVALAWVRRRVPKGAQLTSMGTSSGPNSGGESEVTYTFTGTSILTRPELEYSMVITPQRQLEMRIDAIVAYRPQAT